ncbi:Oidioi.mRNA.OKI2018_I69.chr1.g160.t1.cds [Oikopleura dioica]|uniref:Oidioi.mRNA.OKI2018_I69.chr1.g160.t1.cds n=1 Tax=Oikopleura dioica TaxID=34765 RepID=A0ABN7SJH2_OIKDI|nr:Oidioi.mRNA.OKI2018_I69.chr1.g160.t1.cds [Oikopleura dioica]
MVPEIPDVLETEQTEISTENPLSPLVSTAKIPFTSPEKTTSTVIPEEEKTEKAETSSTDQIVPLSSTTEQLLPVTTTAHHKTPPIPTTKSTCEPKLWFVPHYEEDLHFYAMERICNFEALEFENTVGYVSFFRNETEFEDYRRMTPLRKEYLGYKQRTGDNAVWFNADGSPATFTYWDDFLSMEQPDNVNEICVQAGYIDGIYFSGRRWHDVDCENTGYCGDALFSCRLETICPDSEVTTTTKQPTTTENPCDQKLCLNGGSPLIDGDNCECSCPDGYSGQVCQETPCLPDPCNQHGQCLTIGSDYKCNCYGDITETSTADQINTPITITQTSCEPKLWFVPRYDENLHFSAMERECFLEALQFDDTVGYVAFFRNEIEFEDYRRTTTLRKEYLGYKQKSGNNDVWFNADGSPATFLYWDDTPFMKQPDNVNEICAQAGFTDAKIETVDRQNNKQWVWVYDAGEMIELGNNGTMWRMVPHPNKPETFQIHVNDKWSIKDGNERSALKIKYNTFDGYDLLIASYISKPESEKMEDDIWLWTFQ